MLRHLYKSDMALYRDGTNAVVYNIGLSDSGVSSYAQWSIAWTGDGYVIRGGGNTSFTLQPAGGSATGGTSIIVGNEPQNSASRWNITEVTDAPTGVYLYDTSDNEMASSEVRYITPEESKSLAALSLTAVAYSPNTTSQSFTWSSSNTAAAKVNSSTGTVTGVAVGTAVITGKWTYNTSKTVSYTVHVTEVPNGTYFIQNRRYEKYIQPDNDDAPSYTVDDGIMEQMSFVGDEYQKWIFIHTGDGYYKITSNVSGYAITVPAGKETTANIDLILKPYTGSDNQKWKITKTHNGSYKIKAKSSENYTAKDLVLDVQAYIVTQNLNIQQREYLDNDSYGDEWWLIPLKNKAIIIVSGLMGSALMTSDGNIVWAIPPDLNKLKCDENGNSIYDIYSYNEDNYGVLDYVYKDVYNHLYTTYSKEYDIKFFAYDWRLSCADAAEKLEKIANQYSSCILVAHSMGGLVASSYLARSSANRSKTEKLITLGTPFTGTAKAIYAFETGDVLGAEITGALFKDVVKNLPATFELLPNQRYFARYNDFIKVNGVSKNGYTQSWDYMKTLNWAKKSNGNIKPMFSQAEAFYNSLIVNGTYVTERSDVDTYKIYGIGEETKVGVQYDENGEYDFAYYSSEGDGTVLAYSALNNAEKYSYKTYAFQKGHLNLMRYSGCIQLIKDIIDEKAYVYYDPSTSGTIETGIEGLIISDDDVINKERITIVAKNVESIKIKNGQGLYIYAVGDKLYYDDLFGIPQRVGTIWSVGEKSFQYILYNDNYTICNTNSAEKNPIIKIDYCNYGLSENAIVFENFNTDDVVKISKSAKNITTQNGIEIYREMSERDAYEKKLSD